MKKLLSMILSAIMIFSICPVASAVETGTPFENSEFYTVGDYTLHYRVFEPENESEKQILLIHGFCLSTVSLEGVAEEYAKRGYRTVLVDVPNFGYSSRETDSTELMDREEVIGDLMLHLGGEWIVGGHSMGGGIAINLACDYSDRVTGLILFAPQTSLQANASDTSPVSLFVMQTMCKIILKLCLEMPFLVRLFLSISFSDAEYAGNYDLTRITDPFRLPSSAAGVALMTTHTRGCDFEKFAGLSVPCVIITGANDRVASKENLEKIIMNAPEGTTVYEFEKGGHMMMEYSPVEVVGKTIEVIGE